MRIVLLGAPGSGKGTQGELLAARLGVRHVASGELLRAHVAAATDLGREVAGFLARGDLVPDDVVLAVVVDAIEDACAATGGYILDGFPRTLPQAQRAHALARERGIEPEVAVYLALADAVARERLAGRAEHGRVDDADEGVIVHRLELFHENMEPLLAFYRERDMLVTVDAAPAVETVTSAVLFALAKLDG